MAQPTNLDDLLPYLMNRLLARLNQDLTERLRKIGYSFQDWRMLAVLSAHDGITLSDLAEAAVIPQPTVSRLASQLEGRGLIARRSIASDQRFVHVFVTREGRAAYQKMFPLAVASYRDAVAGFDEGETDDLAGAVRRMMGNVGLKLLPGEAQAASALRSEDRATA